MDPKFHPGNLSLDALLAQCQAFQGITPAKLLHLQAAEVDPPIGGKTHFNKGDYQKIGDLDKVPEIRFLAVTDPSKVPSMIADQLKEKFVLLFDETLFVNDKEQRALGFARA